MPDLRVIKNGESKLSTESYESGDIWSKEKTLTFDKIFLPEFGHQIVPNVIPGLPEGLFPDPGAAPMPLPPIELPKPVPDGDNNAPALPLDPIVKLPDLPPLPDAEGNGAMEGPPPVPVQPNGAVQVEITVTYVGNSRLLKFIDGTELGFQDFDTIPQEDQPTFIPEGYGGIPGMIHYIERGSTTVEEITIEQDMVWDIDKVKNVESIRRSDARTYEMQVGDDLIFGLGEHTLTLKGFFTLPPEQRPAIMEIGLFIPLPAITSIENLLQKADIDVEEFEVAEEGGAYRDVDFGGGSGSSGSMGGGELAGVAAARGVGGDDGGAGAGSGGGDAALLAFVANQPPPEATWELTGPGDVNEAANAVFNVSLDGALNPGETATIELALSSQTTVDADLADFTAAVNSAIATHPQGGQMSFNGTTLSFTATGNGATLSTPLAISLLAINDTATEGSESFTVGISNPSNSADAVLTTGSELVRTTIADTTNVGGNDLDTAAWNLTGSTDVNEGATASYTLSLDNPLGAGHFASIDLAFADVSSTSTDHSDFVTAVNDAIAAHPQSANLAFDGTTLTFSAAVDGDVFSPLVIDLLVTNDVNVEGVEDHTVTISNPAGSAGAKIETVNGTADVEVATTIADTIDAPGTDLDTATWNLTGPTTIHEAFSETYNVSLSGALQANETATIDLALADVDTTAGDHSDFVNAVNNAIAAHAQSALLSFDGSTLTFTAANDGDSLLTPLAIDISAPLDGTLEPSENFTVTLSNPASTTGGNVETSAANGTDPVTVTTAITNYVATLSVTQLTLDEQGSGGANPDRSFVTLTLDEVNQTGGDITFSISISTTDSFFSATSSTTAFDFHHDSQPASTSLSDGQLANGTITVIIPNGGNSATFDIHSANNNTVSSLTLDLVSSSNPDVAVAGGPFTITINDVPPVVVDLDGDGLEFSDTLVGFDIDDDGQLEQMNWAGADDGFLVYDGNNNGIVDQRSEIAFTEHDASAETDLEALKNAFDTDNDGLLTENDAAWDQFGIWQDANLNGETDEGELQSLSDLGVQSIGLVSDGIQSNPASGVQIHGQSLLTYVDGTTARVGDVSLSAFEIDSSEILSTDEDVDLGEPAEEDPIAENAMEIDDAASTTSEVIAAAEEIGPEVPADDVAPPETDTPLAVVV